MPSTPKKLMSSGIPALDDILCGGLTPARSYLVQGSPGSGKTTLAVQFLMEGVRQGENALYITLSETKAELLDVAASHGWSLDGIEIFELVVDEAELALENQYSMFESSEVELNSTIRKLTNEVDRLCPARVVIDSLAEVKLLSQSSLRYRRQVMALKQFLTARKCTVLFLDDKTATIGEDQQLQSIAHGVFSLEQIFPEYGTERRRLRITKLRGQKYRGGHHDFAIHQGGLAIFPRLVAAEHYINPSERQLSSGIGELDAMLSGGVEYGTSMLLLGPAGSGKSTLAFNYAVSAAINGERAAIFTFDERISTIVDRANSMGSPLEKFVKNGQITIQTVDPAELSPGEFVHSVRQAVEGKDGHAPATVVVIDSLNGYMNAMPEEKFLSTQMRELLTYLGYSNVATFLVVAQHGLLGNSMHSSLDTSYLADSVILFRYFEAFGEVKQVISTLKKRSGSTERSIREFRIDQEGIRVGKPLTEFQGILTGTPSFIGEDSPFMISR